MAHEFVRNIKNTVLKGDQKEPLNTNIQNDLLSDDEHAYIRNQNEYHCLTDNLKNIVAGSDNVEINRIDHNTVEIVVTGEGGTGGDNPKVTITVLENSTDYLTVINEKTNQFEIGLTGEFIDQIDNINDKISEIPDMTDYYNKEEINNLISGISIEQVQSNWLETDEESPSFIKNKPTIPEPVDLTDYYDKEEVDQKISEIETGDFEQVQADWETTDETDKSYIKNKPSIPEPVNLDDYYDKEEVDNKISNIPRLEQVQADWNETSSSSKSFIKNKPNLINMATTTYVDNEIRIENRTYNSGIIPIHAYYDSVNKILKCRYYNSNNQETFYANKITLYLFKNNEGTFSSNGNIIKEEIKIGSSPLPKGYLWTHIYNVSNNFDSAINTFRENNPEKSLQIAIKFESEYHQIKKIPMVYNFYLNLDFFDNEEPIEDIESYIEEMEKPKIEYIKKSEVKDK